VSGLFAFSARQPFPKLRGFSLIAAVSVFPVVFLVADSELMS